MLGMLSRYYQAARTYNLFSFWHPISCVRSYHAQLQGQCMPFKENTVHYANVIGIPNASTYSSLFTAYEWITWRTTGASSNDISLNWMMLILNPKERLQYSEVSPYRLRDEAHSFGGSIIAMRGAVELYLTPVVTPFNCITCILSVTSFRVPVLSLKIFPSSIIKVNYSVIIMTSCKLTCPAPPLMWGPRKGL